MIYEGPQAQTRAARHNLTEQFVKKLHTLYPEQILAIGLYGSTARGQDGPYSDIELFCVIDTVGTDTTYEWVYGAGKAEINVLGIDVAREDAKEVDEYWALSHGAFLNAQCIDGDAAILQELKDLVLSISDSEICETIRGVIVGEFYEWVGKIRNAANSGHTAGVPLLACKFTEMMALVLGLAHQTCYTTGILMLEESLQFPDLPDGYAELCEMVMKGQLTDPKATIASVEHVWAGLRDWTAKQRIEVQVGPWPFSAGNGD